MGRDLPQSLYDFLDRVARLEALEVTALATWADEPQEGRADARRAAGQAIDAAGLSAEWEDVEAALMAWAGNPREVVSEAWRPTYADAVVDADQMPRRVEALPHLLDAAAALLLADRLEPARSKALLDPWRSMIGDG